MKTITDFYHLTPFADILLVEGFLSWDERVVKNFLHDIEKITLKFYHNRPWAVLTDTEDWFLGTPQIEWLISHNSIVEVQKTLTHHAIVVGKSEIKKWQLEKMMMENKTFETRIFENIAMAINWLDTHRFGCCHDLDLIIKNKRKELAQVKQKQVN
jgi:hypothetical protein